MNILVDTTVGSIVADDYRAAAVLTRHGIDFCCKGGRSVQEVCRTKGIDPEVLVKEITDSLARNVKNSEDFNTWPLARLAEHIETVHHRYVEERIAVLHQYLQKLCKVHGENHPELFAITSEFEAGAGELVMHMKKEEQVLFPYIKELSAAAAAGTAPPKPYFGTVRNPVQVMMEEHDVEGGRFRHINQLSWGYAVPPDGCATFTAAMAMLKEFEEDLHMHIHLENNILFPRAVALEAELAN